jgi:hypothetical protein
MSEKVRRIVTVLLALTLAAGLVTQGARAADIGAKMAVTAAMDMPMSGKCDGCRDDQKGMAAAACSLHCSNIAALPLLETVPDPVPAEIVGSISGPTPPGHAAPPDPYPPKPAVLS